MNSLKVDDKRAYRSGYLNSLVAERVEMDQDTLKCYVTQPDQLYFDEIGMMQNIKYLFQDVVQVKRIVKPFEFMYIYTSVPMAKGPTKAFMTALSYEEIQENWQEYTDIEVQQKMHRLFVLNEEYKSRNIINDLNTRFGDYYLANIDPGQGLQAYDVSWYIGYQLMHCNDSDQIDLLIHDVIGEMQETYTMYPVVYNEVKSYFRQICTPEENI